MSFDDLQSTSHKDVGKKSNEEETPTTSKRMKLSAVDTSLMTTTVVSASAPRQKVVPTGRPALIQPLCMREREPMLGACCVDR
jgi:hypothetical protein